MLEKEAFISLKGIPSWVESLDSITEFTYKDFLETGAVYYTLTKLYISFSSKLSAFSS